MKWRTSLSLGVGLFAMVLALAILALGFIVALPPPASAALNDQVPAQFRNLIKAPGAACPGITAPLLAAQLQQESAFDPNSVSSVGAMGIAQFMPGTWAILGRDENHDGSASPFDPTDAIPAQARFMCDLYRQVVASGIPGDPVQLALAGYNAGFGAVLQHHGIPPYPETQDYVRRITGMISRFTAAAAQAVPGTPALLGQLPRSNPRTVAEAIAWARREAAYGAARWYDRCLSFVAQAYGWNHSGVSYAIDHFGIEPSNLRHPGDRNAPAGALLFWDTGHRAGHVALSLGGGLIASNDIHSIGRISIVDFREIERRWGAHYVGWAAPYFPYAG